MSDQQALVQKLWNYCNVLRDDGLSYGDYIEQLTYLLFLKMADEQTKAPFNRPALVPSDLDWQSLLRRDGDDLEVHYRHILTELGRRTGMVGVVFRKSQNRIQDPAKLKRLISDLIDRENWMTLDADVKGDAYEGLLEKNAEDVKTGAGQYFTPRALIKAMVEVMRPEPGMTICDPACGTGGFFLAAHDYISHNYLLDPDQKRHLRFEALHGWEIVDNTARLCVMNMLLHGIGSEDANSPIHVEDSLRSDPGDRFQMVLTNPPFGKKSSMTVVNAEGETEREDLVILRDDFWASTSNKQLNFVQHVKTLLAMHGRAAVVGARQRSLRGWSRGNRQAKAPARMRRSHAPAVADRHLLRPRRQGERVVLRPEASLGDAVDEQAVGLRLPDKCPSHLEAEPVALRRPDGVHPGVPSREPPRAHGVRTLPLLQP